MQVRCCECRKSYNWPHKATDRPHADCPNCHALTTVGKRPRLAADDYNSKAFTDSDTWNPYCPTLGELDPVKKAQRMRDGSIRLNPKTGNYEGYFDTQAKYKQALYDQGVMNSWGIGKIDERKQGWDGQHREG